MALQFESSTRNSASLETLKLPSASSHSLGAELAKTKPRHTRDSLCIDCDTESEVGSSLADDIVDEEEVIFALDENALAQLPTHLQEIMREIQEKRFSRLPKENPGLKIRSASFCYIPEKAIREKHSLSMSSWLAVPQSAERSCFRHFKIEYPALIEDAFTRSLGSDRTQWRWSEQPRPQANAFGRQRSASAAGQYHHRSI
jgi:hypothetical protein